MKVILITGCSAGGIGAATAEEFHRSGECKVYASARSIEKMKSLSAGIERIQLDVSSLEGCKSAVAFILEKEGKIDILMNNAGAGGSGKIVVIIDRGS